MKYFKIVILLFFCVIIIVVNSFSKYHGKTKIESLTLKLSSNPNFVEMISYSRAAREKLLSSKKIDFSSKEQLLQLKSNLVKIMAGKKMQMFYSAIFKEETYLTELNEQECLDVFSNAAKLIKKKYVPYNALDSAQQAQQDCLFGCDQVYLGELWDIENALEANQSQAYIDYGICVDPPSSPGFCWNKLNDDLQSASDEYIVNWWPIGMRYEDCQVDCYSNHPWP
ncbi:hypothetical protein [Pedobacter sp. MW01-1-1]|uniref:hypothetical protein n=1 Tax=Pedobacter sp. MW01-1-1 TaxID=3383027 RepID=UPI003FEFA9A1